MHTDKVYIILINYIRWQDTIECLESIFRSTCSNFRVMVIDNNSRNGSIDRIREWAKGRHHHEAVQDNPLNKYVFPPINKPLPYITIDAGMPASGKLDAPLILIQNDSNSGFTGGNNIGIRLACHQGDARYLWLLNNDTVISPDALQNLVTFARQNANPADIVGAILYRYDNPDRIQAYGGGSIKKVIGINRNAMAPTHSLDYITGASMFFSVGLVTVVGLFDEDYFLNWEDIDLSARAVKAGGTLRVCANAAVYHKETVTIGRRSHTDIYYRTRNSFIFTRKHYPLFLPVVLLFNTLKLAKGIVIRDFIYLKAIYCAYRDFICKG